MLKRCHEMLIEKGVVNYPRERLFDDYRSCAAMGVSVATEYCRGGIIERLNPAWLPMLERPLPACDDLNGGELW